MTEAMPSSTARAALVATTAKASPWNSKTLPESARQRACGRLGQVSDLPTPPTEQKQKKRTFDVLPKPANLISYRQLQYANYGGLRRPCSFDHDVDDRRFA